MSKNDRKAYIKAVQCLRELPSKSDKTWAPAAKTRYDDFVAVHVNQTLYIHGNGLFLTWHRYFVWAYEKALRDECGYQGYQPVSFDLFAHHGSGSNHLLFASTGIGSRIPMTSTSRQCSTEATLVWAEMASSLHTTAVLPAAEPYTFHPGKEADVSRVVLSKSDTIQK